MDDKAISKLKYNRNMLLKFNTKKIFLVFLLIAITTIATKIKAQNISSEFPFQSKYLEVKGSKMYYIEEYNDDNNPNQLTFLFIHGNPTSSYLWRNIIPYVKENGKAVAIDLIGMGKSDKPDIAYTLKDHIKYVNCFIKKKKLKNIVLVLHDWGSAIGFHYASHHEKNIKAMIFMESLVKPKLKWNDFNPKVKQLFQNFRDAKIGHKMIAENNFFINKFLFEIGTIRDLSTTEKVYYNAPYSTVKSRKPIEIWPKEIPIESLPTYPTKIMTNYVSWLKQTKIPKLLLYAKPGMIMPEEFVEQFKKEVKNLDTKYIGKGVHYLQEDNPHAIGKAIKEWINNNYKLK